jgi:hypothetical protein
VRKVGQLDNDGYTLVGGIGPYDNTWRMAYVRGPEGIIVYLPNKWAAATTGVRPKSSTPPRRTKPRGACRHAPQDDR